MEKRIEYPGIGLITIRKRMGNRAIRLSVHPRTGITLSIPWYVTYTQGISFVEQKKDWVIATLHRQKQRSESLAHDGKAISSPKNNTELEALRRRARAELVPRLERFAIQFGFTDPTGTHPLYSRIFIKNNVSNWGSCSSKNNINLNMRLVFLPAHLQDYVLIHELCHLRHHNHGRDFHRLLDTLLQGQEKSLRHELRSWRLL